MDIHDGHRKRLKRRFAEYGLDNFEDINAIELLLFYAVPRQDTNAIAHALIDRFGSLDEVFEASITELEKVEGVGENTALLLKLIPQISRRYLISKNNCKRGTILSSTTQAGSFILPLFMYEKSEVVYIICLDSQCKVLCCKKLSQGVVNAAEVSVRRIVEIALNSNAVSVILAHNHTCGLALPSREDEITTRRIASALALVGIDLKDHIIVAGEDYISFADSGLMNRC
ncbi:MAG: DNA repair protein RadC [Clostridia bacterium]|nr:DNA repair protein RadC [Clostridia bacterium]NCC68641.1 DNA repair protein RadC [Clostridia bacterium]